MSWDEFRKERAGAIHFDLLSPARRIGSTSIYLVDSIRVSPFANPFPPPIKRFSRYRCSLPLLLRWFWRKAHLRNVSPTTSPLSMRPSLQRFDEWRDGILLPSSMQPYLPYSTISLHDARLFKVIESIGVSLSFVASFTSSSPAFCLIFHLLLIRTLLSFFTFFASSSNILSTRILTLFQKPPRHRPLFFPPSHRFTWLLPRLPRTIPTFYPAFSNSTALHTRFSPKSLPKTSLFWFSGSIPGPESKRFETKLWRRFAPS